jgi:hypothetical protein
MKLRSQMDYHATNCIKMKAILTGKKKVSARSNRTKLDYEEINRLCQKRKFDEISEMLLQIYKLTNHCCNQSTSEIVKKYDPHSNHTATTCTSTINDRSEHVIHTFEHNASQCNTFLHVILIHKPPFDVVDLLCQLLNYEANGRNHSQNKSSRRVQIEETSDKLGRKPIHVAIQHGCDANVVSRLMQRRSTRLNLCLALDQRGRSPLHWAVDASKTLATASTAQGRGRYMYRLSCHNHAKDLTDADNMFHIIQLLLDECPRAATLKDIQQNRPIDLARQYRAEPRIILALLETETSINEKRLLTPKDSNNRLLNIDDSFPSHRESLGKRMEDLQDHFFPSEDNFADFKNYKAEQVLFTPEKPIFSNFADVFVEWKDDDDISMISCDGASQRNMFFGEFLEL